MTFSEKLLILSNIFEVSIDYLLKDIPEISNEKGYYVSKEMAEDKYKVLKKEALIFDQNFLKELRHRYDSIKRKYLPLIVIGTCFLVLGGLPQFPSDYFNPFIYSLNS